ncbi:MAG: DUF3021 domain-containing protein [Lachnospiraceae bacterium]|nr:DUF3021 domain-containing protein [Lachnospiraceae bacterium]
MKGDKKLSLWERYLVHEIGIEFKACLYFFAVLFFYCVVRIIGGVYSADILHMTQMILACYVICYMQFILFWDFDEADTLGAREISGMVICTALYCALSYVFGWFDRKLTPTLIFAAYILVTYLCVFLIYKTKRHLDDKKLNEELKIFQSEHKK